MNNPNATQNLIKKGAGRPKGSKNKATKVRDDYIEVFYRLGGVDAFIEFLKENKKNKRDYYNHVLPMLLPKVAEVTGDNGGPLKIELIERFSNLPKGEDATTS